MLPDRRLLELGDLFLTRERHEQQRSLDRQGEKRWPITWQIVEKTLLPLTTIGKCSSLIELLPGLLKPEKGLCRGPESAPQGMPPISPPLAPDSNTRRRGGRTSQVL
jgi:hypothetical protein